MPTITDEDSLKAWLDSRPAEDARLIAARAALRALPGLAWLFRSDRITAPFAIILPVFRAIAVASVAAKMPTQRQQVQEAARSAASTALSAHSAHSARSAADSARSAADSAYSARSAALSARSAALSAYSAHSAALSARSTAASAAWKAVEQDAVGLEDGMAHGAFMTVPLWHEAGPPEGLAEAWPELRDRLLAEDPLWHVWTDWVQDQLAGRTMIEALEVKKALIPDEDWEKGPAHVNAIIAGLIEKHATSEVPELPEPAPTPTEYVFNGEVLDIVPESEAPSPNDATEIAWAVLKESLETLKQGGVSNSMRIMPAVDRTLASLGDAAESVNVVRCGMAGMELEAFARTADGVLMEDAAAMLKAVVAQHALFISQFDEWQSLKAKLHQPLAAREDERSAVSDAADLHKQMADDCVLSDAAETRMSEEEAAALPEPAVTGEVVEAEPESQRGFLRSVRAALRAFAVDVLAKMRGQAITATALTVPSAAALAFVKYSDTLTKLAATLPSEFGWVLQWIQWLKSILT